MIRPTLPLLLLTLLLAPSTWAAPPEIKFAAELSTPRNKSSADLNQLVTPAQREKAQRIYRQLPARSTPDTLAALQEAIDAWPHPRLFLRQAFAFDANQEPRQALLAIWAGLRYDDTYGLGEPTYLRQFEAYLLKERLFAVHIESTQQNFRLSHNQQVLLQGRGHWYGIFAPGEALPTLSTGTLAALNGAKPGQLYKIRVHSRQPTHEILPLSQAHIAPYQERYVGFSVAEDGSIRYKSQLTPVPSQVAKICTKPTGDTATVCAEYQRLRQQIQSAEEAARQRLEAQMHGGVVDELR